MTLVEFISTFVKLETVVRIYVRYPDEKINLWCDYHGKAENLIHDKGRYTALLSTNVERVEPSCKKMQAMLDIHTVRW